MAYTKPVRPVVKKVEKTKIATEEEVKTDEIESQLFEKSKTAEFINQDFKELAKIDDENPLAIPQIEADARQRAIQIMNVIRLLSPAISVAMNEEKEDLAQAQLFNNIMNYSHQMALITGRLLGADDKNKFDKWIFNYLERVYSESVCSGKSLRKEINIELVKCIIKKADENKTYKEKFIPLPSDVSLNMALLKAMTPVIVEQEKFSFFRDKEKDKDVLVDMIYENCGEMVNDILDPLAKKEERITLFQILSEEAGKILANAWSIEAIKVQNDLSYKTEPEMEALHAAHPDGISLEKVIQRYKSQFRRLCSLSKQIRIPKK